MGGTGFLRRLILIFLLVPITGCAYSRARFHDFADVWRLEAKAGLGLQADFQTGELLHFGIGSSHQYSFGFVYGSFESGYRYEDHFPLSIINTMIDPNNSNIHSFEMDLEEGIAKHRCYTLFPGGLYQGDVRRSDIHYFDFEVNVLALIVGFQFGFSLGEWFDFLLGWIGIDIADDDDPVERERHSIWIWEKRSKALLNP